MAKEFYEEVIEEIGTQTLARLGLNIFSLNTYGAYGASVAMSADSFRAYDRHRNNPNYHGQTFEELDIGQRNMQDALLNTGHKTYTTDTLADIKKVQGILASHKKLDNLSPKDQAKVEHILAFYSDEVQHMDFSKLGDFARTNHNTTDTITLDKEGNVINTAQLKVIKDTKGLLEDRYLEAGVDLRMPYEDYKRHKENLEKMAASGGEQAQKAKQALDKLNTNNTTNRWMCENPRATALMTQSVAAGAHMGQAGLSDAIVASLSTLASGIVWEIKDMYAKHPIDTDTSILERIKRLLSKTLEAFKAAFARGAGFVAIDVVVGTVGQIFKSVAGSLRQLWGGIRNAAKSIYNGIVSYIKGEIKSFRDLLKTILKSLFSAAWVVAAVGVEKGLEAKLAVIAPPLAPFVAPILAIVAGAFAVVASHRGIDMALDSLFGAFAARDRAKMRAEEIAQLVEVHLPALIAKREELEVLIASTHQERLMALDACFQDYERAYAHCDGGQIYNALEGICQLYGGHLETKTMQDVQRVLENPNRTGKLRW
ncbi:hypothetical protein NHP21005_08840 [Helicobacter sp. NHP21005]|uniref:hypothetical protein n=1 Tax=Helicobacter felistomachi TaxID=3040201 RepID=UPI0025723083|nr:hypothetical protein [Helicobacter sp. NHP21005]BEG57196.1 hypothetical protein NHP21005_08840 [Helicobacter sp. NHP21005]